MLYRTLLKMWFLPPLLNIGLILLGWWLISRSPKGSTSRKTGSLLIVLSCLLLYLFSTQWFANVLMRSVEQYPPLNSQDFQALRIQVQSEPTAIIVLGSAHSDHWPEFGFSQPDVNGQRRVTYGVWLAKQLDIPVLVTGGAARYTDTAHAEVLAGYAKQHLGYEVRWIEDQARTTNENASLSKAILSKEGISQILLVTQSYHMTRSVDLFERQGLSIIAAPTELASEIGTPNIDSMLPSVNAFTKSYAAIHEQLGLLWYNVTR